MITERDANLQAQIHSLRAEVEQLRAALRMVTMFRQLGGMLPGTQQVVMSVVEAADAALKVESA